MPGRAGPAQQKRRSAAAAAPRITAGERAGAVGRRVVLAPLPSWDPPALRPIYTRWDGPARPPVPGPARPPVPGPARPPVPGQLSIRRPPGRLAAGLAATRAAAPGRPPRDLLSLPLGPSLSLPLPLPDTPPPSITPSPFLPFSIALLQTCVVCSGNGAGLPLARPGYPGPAPSSQAIPARLLGDRVEHTSCEAFSDRLPGRRVAAA